jgi:phage FluMu protein Com
MALWLLSAELTLLLLLELLLCAWAVAWMWFQWKDRQVRHHHEAEVERYMSMACPNCHQPFGLDVEWLAFTGEGASIDVRGQPFAPHLGICCPHCRYLNSYDEAGSPQFGQGFFFNHEQWCNSLELPAN